MTTFLAETKYPLSRILKQHPDLSGISPRTVLRWTQRPTRGVKLESLRVGGRTLTSIEAVGRFLAKLNSDEPPTAGAASDSPSSPRSPHQRQRASAASAAELTAAGC